MAANGWDEALLRADDGPAPADRDMDVPFFIIYRGQTYRRQPQSVPPPGNLGEAQSKWKAHYESPAEVAWRRARKTWGTDSPLRVTGMMVTARVANLGRAQRAPLEMRAAGEKNESL